MVLDPNIINSENTSYNTFADKPKVVCFEREDESPKRFSDNWDKYVFTFVILVQYLVNVIKESIITC
jgi:hypothetical protein